MSSKLSDNFAEPILPKTGSREDKRNPLLGRYNNYQLAHVGGTDTNSYTDNSEEYIKEQSEIIARSNKRVPKTYLPPYNEMQAIPYGLDVYGGFNPFARNGNNDNFINKLSDENIKDIRISQSERYDPYTDYLYKNGLIDRDNNVRYDIYYLNIDSSYRTKTSQTKTENPIQLDRNPFKLIEFSTDGLYVTTQLVIDYHNCKHNLAVNDNIQVSGVLPKNVVLRTIDDTNQSPFVFYTGEEYLKITFVNATGIQSSIYNGDINGFPWNENDQDDLYIELKGFHGSSLSHPYIGNIPINTLNKTHRIYLTTPTNTNFDQNIIYIKLIHKFESGTINPLYKFTSSYNVTLSYLYTDGVPNNLINSEYPINFEHRQGYLTIAKVDKSNVYINISHRAGNFTTFGGAGVYIAKVLDVIEGYSNPNNYQIDLGRAYGNITYATIISSEFPNSQNIVKDIPEIDKNNSFYWENLDDGSHIYKINITPGNYTKQSIAKELEDSINRTTRVNHNYKNTKYTNKNKMIVHIDSNTDIVTFDSYKEALLQKPFIGVIPAIPPTPSLTDPDEVRIQVKQLNHKLQIGEHITFSGAISYFGIPENILNRTHVVSHVYDENTYGFDIKYFNLEISRHDNGGGNTITLLVPNVFRLRLDFSDSICALLGFHDVGLPTSITHYRTIIKNNQLYENELDVDGNGNKKNLENHIITLQGDSYLLIQCPQLGKLFNIDIIQKEEINGEKEKKQRNTINNIFGKILLKHNNKNENQHDKIIFDSYVHLPQIYYEPIPELYKLDFKFLAPDGSLFNFNNVDHSFTLKIVTVYDHPKGTSIDSIIGKTT